MTRVKICGITNVDDALTAVECGADAVGFVFAPSPRQMTIEEVKQIASKLPPFIATVGVFVDSELEEIWKAMSECAIDFAQLHGREGPGLCEALYPKVIKAFTSASLPATEGLARYRVSAVMLDKEKGTTSNGTELRRLWELASQIGRHTPIILAGGLTPENVGEAIEVGQPYAVDVSSGVESVLGKKDYRKMGDFIRNAKRGARGGGSADP
jgi:phosphoribosylanthranilate isomerase